MNDPVCDLFRGREPFGKLLHDTARDLRSLVDDRVRPLGMSDARWKVLFCLHMLEKPSPQHQIAHELNVTGPTLVRMLDALERDGLVRRSPGRKDRRVKLVEMLPAGRDLLKKIVQIAQQLEAELFAPFTEEEDSNMRAQLNKLRRRVAELSSR